MNIKQLQRCVCRLEQLVAAGGGGGGAGINVEGEWTSLGDAYSYEVGDVVVYDIPDDGFGANAYYCIADHVSNIAVTPDIDASWVLLVGGGADGAAGDPSIHALIEAPSNKTYVLVLYANQAGTIDGLVAKTTSGTLTADLRINGVSVTGLSAVAVTSVESNTASAGANTFVVGDTIEVVVSAVSSPVDLQLSVTVS
jgi:hypothetical protein